MLRRRKWTITVTSLAVALGVAGLAALSHVGAWRQWGLSEQDYAQVQPGMSGEHVGAILGEPTKRVAKDPDQPDMQLPILNRTREDLSAAAEVWRWERGLQTMGVVFDGGGRVIHKWVDY
ncbi:MAG: hypothetical protein PVH68_14455 [Armatimonadota bacterium]|jgi:hypothetical protein